MRCSCGIILKQCGYGGIGRRVWFRSICSQGHAGSSPVIRTMIAIQNVWHCQNSSNFRAVLLSEIWKFSFKNEGWHWAFLPLWWELNPHKRSISPPERSKCRQISILIPKNSIQSFGLGFSGFHEMWKHWNRVLFCFPENQVIEILSAICEPFLTALVAVRETTPPRATKATVNDLWASCEADT